MSIFSAVTTYGTRMSILGLHRGNAGIQLTLPTRAGLLKLADCVGTIPSATRDNSSSSKREIVSKSEREDDERKWTLLYHRRPSRNTYTRALLGVSSFNLTYWTWYVADFTPSVNSSAHSKAALGQITPETLDMLLIDPNMGCVGLGMAGMLWLGSYWYTKQLVSAIWAPMNTPGEQRSALAVSTLKLPFLSQPKILGKTIYDPENNAFDRVENIAFMESELEREPAVKFYAPGDLSLSEEQKKNDVIVKFDGDFSKLRGHVSLRKEDNGADDGVLSNLREQRYLLDIESEQEVMTNASPTLLRSLVLEDYHMADMRKAGRKGEKRKKGFRKRRRR